MREDDALSYATILIGKTYGAILLALAQSSVQETIAKITLLKLDLEKEIQCIYKKINSQ